jgi:hypothetical protein
LPETQQRTLSIQVNDYSTMVVIFPGKQNLRIPVKRGYNQIVFQGLDKPTQTRFPNGDTRTLLIGILDLNIRQVNN